MITLEKYNNDIYELEQIILEYEFLSEEEKTKIRAMIRNNREKRTEQQNKDREIVAIAEKIYNDVKADIKNQKSCSPAYLRKKYKIGISTSNYIIDKLLDDNIIEYRYGTYWIKNNI